MEETLLVQEIDNGEPLWYEYVVLENNKIVQTVYSHEPLTVDECIEAYNAGD